MQGLEVLTPKEYEILKAIAIQLFPPEGDISLSAEDIGIARDIDKYFSELKPRLTKFLKFVLNFFDISPFFLSISFKRFSRMKPITQKKYLKKWENSRLYLRRSTFMFFKYICGMSYYRDTRVKKEIDFYVVCEPELEK